MTEEYWKSKVAELEEKLKKTDTEFAEFQETSREYEQELEYEIEQNKKWIAELEKAREQHIAEATRYKERYNTEVISVEKESDGLKKQLQEKTDKLKQVQTKIVNLEMENENFENSLRMSESIIMDLE